MQKPEIVTEQYDEETRKRVWSTLDEIAELAVVHRKLAEADARNVRAFRMLNLLVGSIAMAIVVFVAIKSRKKS